MISGILPYTELLESVKIETGYTNIRNIQERIKILATDAEKRLGYNTALVLKQVPYTNDGVNFNGNDLWLPTDLWEFTAVYDGDIEIESYKYNVIGAYIYFLRGYSPKNPIVIYHALTFDGFGWPLMSRNHKHAITAYIVWKLFTPKAFQSGNRSERALVKDFEQDWRDERDAAIGNDVMPGSEKEFEEVMNTWASSQRQLTQVCIIKENEYALQAKTECVLRQVETELNIYHWQLRDRTSNITMAPNIDQNYLDINTEKSTLEEFVIGKTIPYLSVGRIAFAIQGIQENEYEIFDILGQSVDSIVFDKYYNTDLKLHIYISKEFYSVSNIFFKLKKR